MFPSIIMLRLTIPLDASENAGELFKLDIPALSKAGASPVSEY